MATSSVKIQVEGLSQFKSNIQQARNSVKTYDAELKLNEAQMRAGGDATEYATKKAKLLQDELKEQEKIVAQCEAALKAMSKAGIEPAAKDYQDMKQQMLNAKTAATSITAALKSNTTELDAQAKSAENAASQVSNYGDKINAIGGKLGLDTISNVVSGINTGLISAIKYAAKLGQAMWDAEVDASVWADDLMTQAITYRTDVETLQRWYYAEGLIDTSVESLMKARTKIMNASDTGEDYLALMEGTDKSWKVSLKDESGELRDWNDVMWDTIDMLNTMDETLGGSYADTAAQELFGRSFDDMIPLIQAGREEWEAAMAEAPILSEEKVNSLGSFNDEIEKLNSQADTTKYSLLSAIAEPMSALAVSLTEALAAVDEWANSDEGQAALENFANALGGVITSFVGEDGEGLQTLVDGATSAITTFTGILEEFDATKAIDFIKKLALNIVGLNGALTVLKVLNAAKLFSNLSNIGTTASAAGAATTAGTAGAAGAGATGTAAASGLKAVLSGASAFFSPVNVAETMEYIEEKKEEAKDSIVPWTAEELAEMETLKAEKEAASSYEVVNPTSQEYSTASINERMQSLIADQYESFLDGVPEAKGISEELVNAIATDIVPEMDEIYDVSAQIGSAIKEGLIAGYGNGISTSSSGQSFNVGSVIINDRATGDDILTTINFKSRISRAGYGG